MGNIEVRGYSERGMINAMIYEMMYSPDGINLLKSLLKLCIFPYSNPNFETIQHAKFRIEQSFSDFGNLDLLILLDGENKQAILLEAKVKTYQATHWSISTEWGRFKNVVQGTLPRSKVVSNLFIQLYRKMCLTRKVKAIDMPFQKDAIMSRWSLGNNAIVREAAQELAQYCSNVWYVVLIPDSEENLKHFFEQDFETYQPNLPCWDNSSVGYLSWNNIIGLCRRHDNEWEETLSNFTYNDGQIFASEAKNEGHT